MTKKEFEQKLLIQPKALTVSDGECKVAKNAPIYTNVTADIRYLLGLAGFEGQIHEIDAPKDLYVLCIGTDTAEAKEYVFENDETFYMTAGADCVTFVGSTLPGMLLGLKAWIRMLGETDVMPQMEMKDYPDIAFRSVHTCMFPLDDGTDKESTTIADVKRMMRTAAICGYNYIFIEFWGMFPYSMDYAHWPEAYTKEALADLISYGMDKLYIRPLPAQNLTTHAAWSRIASRKHVVLDQRPDLAELFIPGGWCFATENPATQEYLKTVMDELLELFRDPPYLHACCDKAFGFASTEHDRMFSADVLFAKHVTFLSAYLARKNTRMIMWADMLYSSMDALYWKCDEKTADYLPRNIVMNIWTHENPGDDWNDPAFFEEKGFSTIYAPFMNAEGINSMVSLCRKRRSMGMVQTTWHRPQTAAFYVGLTGALQWCGVRPDDEKVAQHKRLWYCPEV